MTASVIDPSGSGDGRFSWRGERDDEGHRTWWLQQRVVTTDPLDGPAVVMEASGLPAIGDQWNFGNDVDIWAFCYPTRRVSIYKEKKGDPSTQWLVESKFSTVPFQRCSSTTIENPLLEPQKISGSFTKYTTEATRDRNGVAIISSSYEMIRGPQVEFDANRPTVRIEQNVAALGLSTFSQMVDTVNDATLWGLGARRIKLSNVSWTRNYYGVCNFYYTRTFDFDINFNTFDRIIIDEGTKVLRGEWQSGSGGTGTGTTAGCGEWVADGDASASNPSDFQRAKDCNGENIRVLLNGAGLPLGSGTPVTSTLEYYPESNFLLLNIPTSL